MRDIHFIHCPNHKCLTIYYLRVTQGIFNRCLPWRRGHRHHNGHLQDSYEDYAAERVASVNNRALDSSPVGHFSISRSIRDPRDLVVSGYFCHRKGSEHRTTIPAPSEKDWYFANGFVAGRLRGTPISFAEHLNVIPKEEGLWAELAYRKYHLESMAAWPLTQADIVTSRYDAIVQRRPRVFSELSDHCRLSPLERTIGKWSANRYAYNWHAGRDRPILHASNDDRVDALAVNPASAPRIKRLLSRCGFDARGPGEKLSTRGNSKTHGESGCSNIRGGHSTRPDTQP